MSYLVITTDGILSHCHDDLPMVEVLGPEGKARVRLDARLAVAGYVNDCALNDPDSYPRNEVGTCVLYSLGAPLQPYAGAVAFVGWNAANAALGRSEISPLRRYDTDTLGDLHADVRRALAGDPPRQMSPSWGEQMREVAHHARTAPTSGITLRTVTGR